MLDSIVKTVSGSFSQLATNSSNYIKENIPSPLVPFLTYGPLCIAAAYGLKKAYKARFPEKEKKFTYLDPNQPLPEVIKYITELKEDQKTITKAMVEVANRDLNSGARLRAAAVTFFVHTAPLLPFGYWNAWMNYGLREDDLAFCGRFALNTNVGVGCYTAIKHLANMIFGKIEPGLIHTVLGKSADFVFCQYWPDLTRRVLVMDLSLGHVVPWWALAGSVALFYNLYFNTSVKHQHVSQQKDMVKATESYGKVLKDIALQQSTVLTLRENGRVPAPERSQEEKEQQGPLLATPKEKGEAKKILDKIPTIRQELQDLADASAIGQKHLYQTLLIEVDTLERICNKISSAAEKAVPPEQPEPPTNIARRFWSKACNLTGLVGDTFYSPFEKVYTYALGNGYFANALTGTGLKAEKPPEWPYPVKKPLWKYICCRR